jgi:hypothetical protein
MGETHRIGTDAIDQIPVLGQQGAGGWVMRRFDHQGWKAQGPPTGGFDQLAQALRLMRRSGDQDTLAL